jgi:hypothetical protein
VAPPGYEIRKGERVINVGCNNGEEPSIRRSRITSLDRYMGPPNLQVAGLPVQGRSGGGLFSEDGLVIGVCNAADPSTNEGLYAALPSIHAELDERNLAFVHERAAGTGADASALASSEPPPMPREMPGPSDFRPLTGAGPETATSPSEEGLSAEERAALAQIRRRRAEGAEVVCVIRSLSDPTAPSEILVLDRVSPAFLEQLAAEANPDDPRRLTSLEVADGPGN